MKRICIVILMLLLVCSLVACGDGDKKPQNTGEFTIESDGYYLYQTTHAELYLDFFASFDTNKYEIIDISVTTEHSMSLLDDYRGAVYAITYKLIQNVEEPEK